MFKKFAVVALAIGVVIGGMIIFSNKSKAPIAPIFKGKSYTVAEVAERNSKELCWTIINGSVYDITAYIPKHPGGDEILRVCGTDGTTLFTQRQTNDGETVGSGEPHSGSATTQLEQYKIGIISSNG